MPFNQRGVQFQFCFRKTCFRSKLVFFPLNWNECSIKHWIIAWAGHHCDTLSKHLSDALNNSGPRLSPSSRPISPSCPKYRASEITLLPADLLSHRAFSTVIPHSSHSCRAKIDLHPCVIGSGEQIPNYYSAPLIFSWTVCESCWNRPYATLKRGLNLAVKHEIKCKYSN